MDYARSGREMMNHQDKMMIRNFRDRLADIAKMSQEIVQKGYILAFNIDSSKGIIDKFEVKAPVDIDDEGLLN